VAAGGTALWATCLATEDTAASHFYLKMKDSCLSAAIMYLRQRGLFNDDDDDDDDGDNPAADFEW